MANTLSKAAYKGYLKKLNSPLHSSISLHSEFPLSFVSRSLTLLCLDIMYLHFPPWLTELFICVMVSFISIGITVAIPPPPNTVSFLVFLFYSPRMAITHMLDTPIRLTHFFLFCYFDCCFFSSCALVQVFINNVSEGSIILSSVVSRLIVSPSNFRYCVFSL